MVFVEPKQITTIYDYLTTLTAKEREELAMEINYSHAYFNWLVSTRKNLSEFLASLIYMSEFNQSPSRNGAKLTKKILDAHIEDLKAIRMVKGKKRRLAKSKSA